MATVIRVSSFTIVLVGAMIVACSRYQYVNELDSPECKNRPPPQLVHGGAEADVSFDSTAWFRGVVVNMDTGDPLGWAQVQIQDGDSSVVVADSIGQFAFAGRLHRGSVRLGVRRLGFAQYSDTVTVPLPAGVRWRIALAVMPFDGPCSGMLGVRVRKPWWKFW